MSEAGNKRRRGVVRASITRLGTRLKDLEKRDANDPSIPELAKQMKQKLETYDSEFRTLHYAVIDTIDDDDALTTEQNVIDDHDDIVEGLTVRMQRLITASPNSDVRKKAARGLLQLQTSLVSVEDAINAISDMTPEATCLLHQYQEQISDYKRELGNVRGDLLSIELDSGDDIHRHQAEVEKLIFDCSLNIKKLIQSQVVSTTSRDGRGVKLPKLDVPTFDGNIINWRSFWDQFSISVHDRDNLSDSEKLVYLQHALKEGSAKQAIEGLSRSGAYYAEAIECLKSRYDRPRLIHQTHVRMILESPSLKDGSGKELRRLHDTVQQHLRALKAMEYEPSGPFITSILELKLDTTSMFEWQKHSQEKSEVPHYQDLLDFINLRAQASETSLSDQKKHKGDTHALQRSTTPGKPIASHIGTVTVPNCILCREKHPLYACSKFKSLSHDQKIATLKSKGYCLNCLRPGHFVRQCSSLHHCKRCQKPHHTLLHVDTREESRDQAPQRTVDTPLPVMTHAAMTLKSSSLLMTCRVCVSAPSGRTVEARGILDSASTASFVSERLAQGLGLLRSSQNAKISGIAGLSPHSSIQAITQFKVSSAWSPGRKIDVTAAIIPHVTCDLPLNPVPFNWKWDHISDIQLADPGFGTPGKIDLLLGVDVFTDVMRHGRRTGPPGSPAAFETEFGWVLAGSIDSCNIATHVATHHASFISGDEILQKFWEIEESPTVTSILSPEEKSVVDHFNARHYRSETGRFVVPLPRKPDVKLLGESRSQAVRRFLSMERSLRSRNQFQEFSAVMNEYFGMEHAERVPDPDLEKPPQEIFYLPMHAVKKESSTTTKIRIVFDASAKSSTGISLNDTLLVGPTVHPPLIDVLLRFRRYRIALTTDVSRMYRAVELDPPDQDLHRFVWRESPDKPLSDYRMLRVTFGVSASSFAANMSVKQNAINCALAYPLAYRAVEDSFYVDDGLIGADSVEEAIELQQQLQSLFSRAGFLLRKWSSSDSLVLQHVPHDLQNVQPTRVISDSQQYTKTLGIEWNATLDHFRLSIPEMPPLDNLTKRALVSDIAKTFDVLGWFSPTIIKMKILLQRLWEQKVGWDDLVPSQIFDVWMKWRSELKCLSDQHIPRCYYHSEAHIKSIQLHGFSDASEQAYAGVVYIRLVDSEETAHISLVMSKTKVAPIKRLTIPRLELCGAYLLAQLLSHVRRILRCPLSDTYAWTDSTIVLNWLVGNPRRFKTYVGNRVSDIVELIPPDRWNHIQGIENPADVASRGAFPSELLQHNLWWNGPDWLHLKSSNWPQQVSLSPNEPSVEESEVCLLSTVLPSSPVLPMDRYSSFSHLKRVTGWILRFKYNCLASKRGHTKIITPLTVQELLKAETYWLKISQEQCFAREIQIIKKSGVLPRSSCLLPLHPFMDEYGLLRVGGRERNAKLPYHRQHPIILQGKHILTKLIIGSEHLRLLHAGPTLLTSSLSIRFHIVGHRKAVRSVTRGCVICRRYSAKPQPQMLGQLPMERVTPDAAFDRVGVDYAGPMYVKYGYVRKPTIVKTYVCVFVSLSVKAVHLELVSDLTSDAFIACLRRFISRRGKPSIIWSDHGSNFVGAARELTELADFLKHQKAQNDISEFCSSQSIQWDFIPEHAPHFGGLWEAAVRSFKKHLRRVAANLKLTFEELTTVLTQIEACLNSRPLTSLLMEDDGVEALTPGHFLIGRPLEALPDPSRSHHPLPLLKRWHLCQAIVRHFWKRWSIEYLSSLQKFTKWHRHHRDAAVGDVVVIKEDSTFPTKWPLAKVTQVYKGKDGVVRVVTVKTGTGAYTRPVSKIVFLVPSEV